MGPCARALLATALALPGCAPEERATLVPLRACGIEGEIQRLRLTARGDFSPAAAPPVQFGSGTGELRELPGNVTGITVEGLFGQSVAGVGRTARLQTEGLLPVYFSALDRVCPVESEIPPREVGAMAVGEQGDVVLVGGIAGPDLSAEILHYRDVEGEMHLGLQTLPSASTGQTLHPFGERRFLSVGGVSVGDVVLPRAVAIEVGDTEADVVVGTPIDLEGAGAPDSARVYHGGADLDDGRILIVGGCSRTIDRACVPEVDATLGSAYLIERSGDGLRVEPNVPPLLQPRYGHHTLVSRDGIVFVVGGKRVVQTIDGAIVETGANSIELLLPGLASWAPYGPSLLEITSPIIPAEDGLPVIPRDIVSATMLEGGQIVIGLADGSIYAVDELHLWPLRNWCGGAANCFDEVNPDPSVPIAVRPRSLFALPGERILADNYLLPVSQLLRDGSTAVNLAVDADAPEPPPGARAGALLRLLDDGTVIHRGRGGAGVGERAVAGHAAVPAAARRTGRGRAGARGPACGESDPPRRSGRPESGDTRRPHRRGSGRFDPDARSGGAAGGGRNVDTRAGLSQSALPAAGDDRDEGRRDSGVRVQLRRRGPQHVARGAGRDCVHHPRLQWRVRCARRLCAGGPRTRLRFGAASGGDRGVAERGGAAIAGGTDRPMSLARVGSGGGRARCGEPRRRWRRGLEGESARRQPRIDP